jgi:hypothetical protein
MNVMQAFLVMNRNESGATQQIVGPVALTYVWKVDVTLADRGGAG